MIYKFRCEMYDRTDRKKDKKIEFECKSTKRIDVVKGMLKILKFYKISFKTSDTRVTIQKLR